MVLGAQECEGEAEVIRDHADVPEKEGEEQIEPKGIRLPMKPSQAEVDRHNLNHATFRDWCEHCVRGRAKNDQHRKRDDSEHAVNTVSVDYNMYLKEEMGTPMERVVPRDRS